MRHFPRAVLVVILVAASLALAAQAQTAGCCCDLANGTAQVDSYLPSSGCLPAYPDFVVPTSVDIALNKTCSTKCGEVATIPPFEAGACGSPDFNPPPGNLSAAPVKGQRAMKLAWTAVCPADAYIISRCAGAGCTSFAQIAVVGPSTSFIDGSEALRWNSAYTYRVLAKYSLAGDSTPATASGGTGDIECEAQFTTDSFCISAYSYQQSKAYLQAYGYAGTPVTPASAFTSDFDGTVNTVFFTKFNKGVACSPINVLSILSGCATGEVCVAQGLSTSCITPTPCDLGSGLFGLGATVTGCEGTDSSAKYCFLDKSSTSVDTCYACNAGLSCYDYKSKGACERNNCGLGSCEWKDTFPDIGAGVCVDNRYNNCAWCNKSGTAGAPNAPAYNVVFDQCTSQKSAALSSTAHPCFFSGGQALDCAKATCKEYTATQCGAPSGGVTLNPDNSVATGSTDPCGIKVCQFDPNPSILCRKNADATPATTYWLDCALNDTACERDYFPPLTTLIPIGSAGKFDYLNIRIWDRSNASDFGHLVIPPGDLSISIGAPNTTSFGDRKEWPYLTYVCAGALNASLCTGFVSFNSTQLNLNNLKLQDGTKVLLNLTPGWNRLRYYSQDPAKNLEIVKNFTLFSCSACQGPKALTFNLSPARQVGTTWYTKSLTPTATIGFNTPADLVFVGFVQGTTTLPAVKTPASGFNLVYTAATPALTESSYTFSANARDTNDLFMTPALSVPVIVDVTPPTATYTPSAGTVLGTGSVTVQINFSEPIVVQNFTIEELTVFNTSFGPIRRPVTRDITGLFTTTNNKTFTATLTLTEGRKTLKPIITDYAGNALSSATNSSWFVINAAPPIPTIKNPPFGVSSTFTFPLAFETDSVSECRYWSSQTLPPPALFSSLVPFETTNAYEHTKASFSEITKESSPYKFYVRCVDPVTGTGSSNFFLMVDKSAPKIITAYAVPNPIVQMPLQTALKVQTDDLTICKYSSSTSSYDSMEGEFPWFNILGLYSHVVNITVPSPASYTYTVACKNLAGLGPASKSVSFSVDLSQPLKLTSITPAYIGNTTIPLGVETNKDTYCYYEQNGVLTPLGDVNSSSMAHVTSVSVPGAGAHTFKIFCSTGSGTSALGIEEASANVSVFVDLTPPWMLFVDDTSNHPDFPDFSYFLDRLRVAFLGTDNETNVSRYFYRVQERGTEETVLDWTPSTVKDGLPWWVPGLNLSDGSAYYFRVKPENLAGLQGADMPSDGVTIDITKIPPYCVNQLFDEGNETDVDCGKGCPPCADLKMCAANVDCVSRICNASLVCQPSLCDDLLLGGNETDVDCGGGSCATCVNGKACAVPEDCASNYCAAGICSDNPCYNSMLDGLESDIDCGGACPARCKEGQSCALDADCESGTICENNVCSVSADSDGDGVPDPRDNCPGTPLGELVDAYGCSASQRYSCGDEIDDAWRARYFGSVLCDGDGASDADPDDDGRKNVREYRDGTNPTIADAGFPWLLVIILLILFALLGWGGYYVYKHPDEAKRRWEEFKRRFGLKPAPKAQPAAPIRPVQKAEAPHVEDWIPVNELKKLGPEDVSAKTFTKLDALIKGKLPEEEHPKLLKQLAKEKAPLDKLRELALQGLSAAERKDLLLKLQLLRKGKLGKEEMEALFRKLRITAEYYEKNKDALEREMMVFVRGRGKR